VGTTGGVPGYSYSWRSLSDTLWSSGIEDPEGLSAGIYEVMVTDRNDCRMAAQTTIREPEALTIDSIFVWNISCNASDDGSARVVEVSGGTPVYTYTWNDPASTSGPQVMNLPKGPYMVTIVDVNGCMIMDSIEIGEPDELIVTLSPVEQYNGEVITCPGESNGEITAVFQGGRPPYSYTWLHNNQSGITKDTLITLPGLAQDTYFITVTDTAACSDVDSLVIEDPVAMEMHASLFNVTCASFNDGRIDAVAVGGTGTKNYRWSTGDTTREITPLSPGDYHLTVTDRNGCIIDSIITITEPDYLTITVDSVNPTCPDAFDGEISIIVQGGTPEYDYLWSTGETDVPAIQNLGADNYWVTVTDNNGCIIDEYITLLDKALSCIVIPTAFTPNHDGFNDKWEIIGLQYYKNAVIEVFNRWGDLVFRSEGNEYKFNGTYRGRDLPMDSYHYIIDLRNGDEPLTGTITIVR
jgi:gliding motility-associated-like protein